MRASFLWALLGLALASGQAVAQPEPRVIDVIDVVGNERFSDADIIATSGLRPGDLVGEPELQAAVEALQFTGEFESIRITSDGSRLRIAVEEEPTFSGGLSFGVGFDTDDGVIGFTALTLRDFGIEGTALNSRFTASEEFLRGRLDLAYLRPVGPADGIGIRIFGEDVDDDEASFDFMRLGVQPYVTFALGERSALELRYTLSETDIGDLSAQISPIIAAEAGSETSSGFGFTFRTFGETGPLRWTFELDQDFTGVGGDTSLSITEAELAGRVDLGQSGFALRSKLAFGAVEGLGSDEPRASDRFVLGGAGLRGFQAGTVSPTDVSALGTTVLGGDRFATLQTDLILPIFQEQAAFETFVFGDLGSVWSLDTDTAPAGIVDTSFTLRSSAGIGASLETPLGRFEAYVAIGVDAVSEDDIQRFGLAFRTTF